MAITRTSLALLLLSALPASAQSRSHIPPAPADWILDEVELIEAADRSAIASSLERAQARSNTRIGVVTIESFRAFGERSIEALARRFLAAWGASPNAMVLLVARDDRQARIELGRGWGRSWDRHARSIMDGQIVPQMRAGSASAGIRVGANALADMAEKGPGFSPPSGPAFQGGLFDKWRHAQPQGFPLPLAFLFLVAGVGCFAMAFRYPRDMGTFLACGALLILGGISVWLLLIVVALFFGGRTRRRSRWSRWGNSAYRPSFSSRGGGGGATGSW